MQNHHNAITAFFIQHPEFFRDLVSNFYAFTKDQLTRYRDFWDWQKISYNQNILWSTSLIREVSASLDWTSFSMNPAAFKDLTILEEFDQLIDWKGGIYAEDSIASNHGLPWSRAFIAQYKDQLNFERLSANTAVPWSAELLETYPGKWDLEELAMNPAFPWTIPLFEKYLNESLFFYHDVQNNPRLISKVDFIEKYAFYLNWSYIFGNPELPWMEQNLMKRWEKHIDWFGVARNPVFFQNDPGFFEQHLLQWKALAAKGIGKGISQNTALPWSIEFISKYAYLWDWETLSHNTSIPWSVEFIEAFASELPWGGTQPGPLYNDNVEIISMFGGEIYEQGLIDNEALPWSLDFITHFEEQIDLKTLAENKGAWQKAFQPYLNDKMLETILGII